MKLEQLTGPIQQMICIRGFVGEWADMARAGKPIPLPPRGMSWWAGIMGNMDFDEIFDEVSDDALWYADETWDGFVRHPTDLTADETIQEVWKWLQSPESSTVECVGWDRNLDHDGSNKLGWRVFVEDWGYVDHRWGVICAVKPAHIWFGK
jgi:hypothetical protein